MGRQQELLIQRSMIWTNYLEYFCRKGEIVDFLKRKQLSRKEIPSDELFRTIRSVKGLESLVAAKRTQVALITEGIITKTANHLYRVNADYVFYDMDKEKVDLKGWNIAGKIEDIPRDFREKETTFVCIDSWNALHLVYVNTSSQYLHEKYENTSIFFPVLWKRLDIPDNALRVLNSITTP